MNSLIIPVYKNEASISALLRALEALSLEIIELEVVFVVDGSPDRSYPLLREALAEFPASSQLIALSRNFGSFAAIRTGLIAASGERFAVMAADLQEPPELIAQFFTRLARGDIDVVMGVREGRADPWASRLGSSLFWWLYRRLINSEIPPGGVDVFACNRQVRDQLVALDEQHSSLIGLLYWVGFRRDVILYQRREREHGRSAWTFRRKLKYMMDSIFSFSDLPIRLLLVLGTSGLVVALALALAVLAMRLHSGVAVPGYAATMITILFFGALNATGLGLLGAYLWRAFANTQRRPLSIIMRQDRFDGRPHVSKKDRAQ